MKAEQELEKEALAVEEVPTTYTDLNAVVIEAEKPCRTQSQLPFLAPNGVFTRVGKSSVSVIIRGQRIEVIRFDLKVNNALVNLDPYTPTPNCNNDGVTFVPAQSINVSAVAPPQVFGGLPERVGATSFCFSAARTNHCPRRSACARNFRKTPRPDSRNAKPDRFPSRKTVSGTARGADSKKSALFLFPVNPDRLKS